MLVTPALGKQRHVEPLVSLARQLNPLSKFQARERPCLKKQNKVPQTARTTPNTEG